MATTVEEALAIAGKIGYPVMVRPSYVLGGRGKRASMGSSRLTFPGTETANLSRRLCQNIRGTSQESRNRSSRSMAEE